MLTTNLHDVSCHWWYRTEIYIINYFRLQQYSRHSQWRPKSWIF